MIDGFPICPRMGNTKDKPGAGSGNKPEMTPSAIQAVNMYSQDTNKAIDRDVSSLNATKFKVLGINALSGLGFTAKRSGNDRRRILSDHSERN